MKIVELKDIKDLFPIGSFGSYRMSIQPERYKNDLVLLIEEDCTIENLNLDDVSKTFSIVITIINSKTFSDSVAWFYIDCERLCVGTSLYDSTPL